ncbi:MAG: hypothetical protein KJ042_09245, partial [Deltaproteobacteria bacterium]|nr:hypothetical protein [Deltaproteobacteria bacterium]
MAFLLLPILAQETGQLLEAANIVAGESEWNHVSELAATDVDVESPAYGRIRQRLMALRNAVGQFRFVYLMRRTGDGIVFLADSEPADSAD